MRYSCNKIFDYNPIPMRTFIFIIFAIAGLNHSALAQTLIEQLPGPSLQAIQSQSGWAQMPIDTNLALALGYFSKDTAYVSNLVSTYRSLNGGQTWGRINSPNGDELCFFDAENGYMAGYGSHTAYHTSDGGQNWVAVEDSNQASTILLAVTKDTAFIIGDDISRTTDAGKTWRLRRPPYDRIYAVSFLNSRLGVVVGAVQPGPVDYTKKGAACLTTKDGGDTWEPQFTGAGDDLFGVAFVNPDMIVAVGGIGYISRSRDGGITWDSIPSPLLTKTQGLLAVSYKGGRIIAVGTPGLIMTSTDAGSTWEQENSGTTTWLSSVWMVDSVTALVTGHYGMILKTTNGGAAWVQLAPPSIESLIITAQQLPETPMIELRYSLPQLQDVTIEVYDLLGKRISTLCEHKLEPAGAHQITVDATRYPVGVYLFRITTERYAGVGKIVLVK